MARDIEADAKIHDKSSAGLRSFERNVRESGKRIEKQYEGFGKGIGNGLLKGIATVAPNVARDVGAALGDGARLGTPLLLSGITAALPVLSGLIGSAVTGGAAGAGIVGGVALAAQDSRVKEAGTQLGRNLLSGLSARAGTYVQPVLQSIDLIEAKFLESGDTIENIFKNTSGQLVPLVDSVGNTIQSVLEGVETASGRAGPVLEALGSGLEEVGASVEGFFDQLSSNAEANAAVLEETLSGLAGTINLVGSSLQAVTYVFGELDKVMPLSLLGQVNELFNGTAEEAEAAAAAQERNNDVMQRGGLTVEQLTAVETAYNKALEDNAAAAERALNAQQGLFSATTAYGEALDRAKRAASDNGKTLSENTAKGRENRSALDSLASAYKRVIAEQEATGGSSAALSARQNKLRGDVYAVALQMTGSAKRARELTNSLLGIPSPKPKVTLNTAGVASQARNARQEIAGIKGKTVTVTVNVNASRLNAVYARLERIGANNAEGDSFGTLAGEQRFRTGGATQVQANVQNTINLDGRPFRAYTQKAIASEQKRTDFRRKVGQR